MSFCFLYNVVSENHSVQNSPWGGGGSIASSRSNRLHFVRMSLQRITRPHCHFSCFPIYSHFFVVIFFLFFFFREFLCNRNQSRMISPDRLNTFRIYLHANRSLVHRALGPAGIWCQNDVVLTSMRRHHVASTLIRRHFGTKCPLEECQFE